MGVIDKSNYHLHYAGLVYKNSTIIKKITVSVYKKTGVEPEQFKKMKNIILR